MKVLFSFLLVCFSPIIFAQNSAETFTKKAVDQLQQWYNVETGLWETTSWWNAANALTEIIRYTAVSGDSAYCWIIDNTFSQTKEFTVPETEDSPERLVVNYINEYYDDEGWWALAWIEAYDFTGNEKYLEMAQTIFEDIKNGWDLKCNGGIYWKKGRPYKAAISNELFMLLGARLALRSHNRAYYQDWALKEWTWFAQSGMINEMNLVHDGVRENCEAKGRHFTYNQGVILAALVDLEKLTGNESFSETAQKLARATIKHMSTADGVLKGYPDGETGKDGIQFKGIFMRHLAYLNAFEPSPDLVAFIQRNARSIEKQAVKKNTVLIGSQWEGPFDQADASRQSSAIGALVSALGVQ